MTTAIIAVILTLAISVPVTFFATSNYRKKQQEETIGNAQEKARAIIDEALTTAENQKRDLRRRSGTAEMKCSATSAGFSRRKSPSTARWRISSARSRACSPRKNR